MPTVCRMPRSWPLDLAQGTADVSHGCASCGLSFTIAAVIVADWLDRSGALAQEAVALGIECPACASTLPFAAPLMQLRRGDVVDLLIALPADSDVELDTEWIASARSTMPEMRMVERIVPVRPEWWLAIASAPLGPILSGVIDPPVPASADEIAVWRASLRELVPVSTAVAAVHQLALADTFSDAQALVRQHPELIQPRWRTTVRAIAAALVTAQANPDAQRLVEHRTLRRLRTLTLFRGGAPADFPDDIRAAIDSATAYGPSDEARLGAIMAAADALDKELGDSVEVAAALTSLARALYDSPSRGKADIVEAVGIATRAAEIAERIFDAEHEFVVMNTLNAFVMRTDLLGDDADEVQTAMEQLRAFALLPGVLSSPHLPDVLVNLAGLVHRRTDLARGSRMELQLDLLAQAQRAADLLDPDNVHLQFVIATNTATTQGSRIAGVKNAVVAADALRSSNVANRRLTLLDRLMRMTTEVSIEFEEAVADGQREALLRVIRRCVELRDEALKLGPDNEAAITALTNSASITSDLVHRLGEIDVHAKEQLNDALATADMAAKRAAKHLGARSSAHLTALVGLGNLQSQVIAEGSSPAQTAAATYRRVVELAEGVSDPHLAVAWRNLGTLHFEAGEWTKAAAALKQSAESRRRLVGSAEGEHLILGEAADSEDLAGREALAWVLASRPQAAVVAIENSRAYLLRRRLKIDTTDFELSECPGGTIIHLSGSSIGTSLVIRGADGLRASEVYAISSEVREVVVELLRARSRATRSAALRRLGAVMQPVLADIVAAVRGDDDLRVVASGGWASVPLHVFLRDSAKSGWAPTVRYLPSEGVASVLRRRPTAVTGDAVALIDPDGDLPLAASEGAAFAQAYPEARTFRGSTTRATALAAITDAQTLHLACHARYDADDPTRSYLSLGRGQRLTFADLVAAADTQHLRLVVASACQSGATGTWNPDEMTAVAHGFLHTGANAVVTALWDVNDLPAALLVCALYNSPLIHTDPATALASAQNWLRTLTPKTAGDAASWLPAELASRLRGYLNRLDLDEAPFADGIDWGAFAYVGP